MLVKTLLIALVSFIGFLECGVGNSMIQRPIVMGPLVGLVLGDVNAGLAVGATLELAFMGNVTIGAAEVKVDGSSYRTRPLPIEIVNEGEGSRAQQQQGGSNRADDTQADAQSRIGKDDILLRAVVSIRGFLMSTSFPSRLRRSTVSGRRTSPIPIRPACGARPMPGRCTRRVCCTTTCSIRSRSARSRSTPWT